MSMAASGRRTVEECAEEFFLAKEEAARAVHAVMDGLKDRVPADVLAKLSESSPVRETARLGRAVAQRLQKDDEKTGVEPPSEPPRV